MNVYKDLVVNMDQVILDWMQKIGLNNNQIEFYKRNPELAQDLYDKHLLFKRKAPFPKGEE